MSRGPMVLVCHAKKFIYLKTAKTAGTSVEVALQPLCMPPGSAVEHATRESETEFGIVGARQEHAPGSRWFNHMRAAVLAKELPAEVWTGYRRICAIRNPWDKVVSFFHFKSPTMAASDPDLAIAAFRNWLGQPGVQLGMDHHIYTIRGVPVIDTWLRFSHLEDDLSALCKDLDIVTPPLPRFKAGLRPTGISWHDYYDEAGREIVRRAFAPAIEMFGWTSDDDAPAQLPPAGDRIWPPQAAWSA